MVDTAKYAFAFWLLGVGLTMLTDCWSVVSIGVGAALWYTFFSAK